MRKPTSEDLVDLRRRPFIDPDFASQYPVLATYLGDEAYDDGAPRRTSTLLLFVQDGLWKACLNDRAAGRSAWVSGEMLTEALSSLENALRTERASWRASEQAIPGKEKKRP